jgi:hypothetical protein
MGSGNSWVRRAGYFVSSLAICLVVSDSSTIAERVARFDTPFLDLSYDGSIFIEDLGDTCRYRLPSLKIMRIKWWSLPITRDVQLDELIISVFGEPPASHALLKLSYPISASFPAINSPQQLAPLEFTIPKRILDRAAYIALATVGTLTIQGFTPLGARADGGITRAAWPMSVSSNRIISQPFGTDPDLARVSRFGSFVPVPDSRVTRLSRRPTSDWGMVRPSALARLRLIMSSSLADCWTGRPAGLSPSRNFPA